MKKVNTKNRNQAKLINLSPELKSKPYISLLKATALLMCVVITSLSVMSDSLFLKEILISQGIIGMLLIVSHKNNN